ncbi:MULTISPECIES: ABC transporter permease subunit [Salinibaculum]|uniref:ABC transporter permease subunit n=1 Tax=Salinibaculum TaxID=2732368 RepID=UPI0030D189E2
MSWAVVARKDFNDARRSRSLWGLSIAFLLLAVLFAALYTYIPEISGGGELSSLGLMGFLSAPVGIFVAVASLVIAYKSVAGETESGSGKLLLSLPNTRRDVLFGKILGRTLVLAIPVVVGLAAMLAVVLATNVALEPVEYALFTAVTLLFVLVYVTLFVGISASTTSTARAATVAVLVLVVVEFAWDIVPLAAWFVLNGFQVPAAFLTGDIAAMPDVIAFLANLPPSQAYLSAVGGVLSGSLSGAGPWYLSQAFSLVVLVVWALVPAGIGYRRYRRADL